MIDNIIDHILKAKIQAEKEYIKANTILIDEDLARTNEMFIEESATSYRIVTPMIFGLEVKYVKNLTKNYFINFALVRSGNTIENEIAHLKAENALLKQKLGALKEVLGE